MHVLFSCSHNLSLQCVMRLLQNKYFGRACTLNVFVHVFLAFSVHCVCYISDAGNIPNHMYGYTEMHKFIQFFLDKYLLFLFFLNSPSSSGVSITPFIYSNDVLSLITEDKFTDNIVFT